MFLFCCDQLLFKLYVYMEGHKFIFHVFDVKIRIFDYIVMEFVRSTKS